MPLLGSESDDDSTDGFDQCCGKDTSCAPGTFLPRILLSVVIVLIFASQMIYARLYNDYPVLPRIPVLPLLVGVPIIAFIMVFWVDAFYCCSYGDPEPCCCCMRTLFGHLRCVYIYCATVLCLCLGLLSFSYGRFGIDSTMADVLFGLSIATWVVGAMGVSIYLSCQISCGR